MRPDRQKAAPCCGNQNDGRGITGKGDLALQPESSAAGKLQERRVCRAVVVSGCHQAEVRKTAW